MDRRKWLAQVSLTGSAALPLIAAADRALGQQPAQPQNAAGRGSPDPVPSVPRPPSSVPASSSAAAARTVAGAPPLKITDIKTILTAPAGIRLVVVKVMTSEPGLYGLGCATFTQRARVVATAIDQYLRPFLLGKDATQIEDTFQSAWLSSYWRNGPVLNKAISGRDM